MEERSWLSGPFGYDGTDGQINAQDTVSFLICLAKVISIHSTAARGKKKHNQG